jgi:SAM-dependent methyltransferase
VCGAVDVRPWYAGDIIDPADVSFTYTFRPGDRRVFPVMRCGACTHAFCSPVPSDIAKHYRDVVDQEYLRHEASRMLAAEAVLRPLSVKRPGARLLDVGCATGDLLMVASGLGFAGEGLELSDWSSRIARSRGLAIHQEPLESLARRVPGTFDVITLLGVIEHFASPRAEVAHIARLLAPGGVLVIWTGDVDSVVSRLLGRQWWYWQGQHIQYFTRRSLQTLMTGRGLDVAETRLFPFAATRETIANSLRRYRLHRLFTGLLRPLFMIRSVWFLYLPGEMLLFAVRPERPRNV